MSRYFLLCVFLFMIKKICSSRAEQQKNKINHFFKAKLLKRKGINYLCIKIRIYVR